MTPAAAAAHFSPKKLPQLHSRVPTQGHNYKIKNKIKYKHLSMG